MSGKERRLLTRILTAAAIFLAGILTQPLGAALGFSDLGPMPLTEALRLLFFMLAYLLLGYDILLRAVRNILRGQVFDENFLMSIATLGAICLGEYAEGVEVMLFYQVGELFQSYAVSRSRRSIGELMDIRPDSANVLRDGALQTVDPEEVALGERIVIMPGERIPLDGVIQEGSTALDTAALTGESMPRDAGVGDAVISGCINQTGKITVTVTKVFGESTVSKILALVENASDKKSKSENFITRFARYYTPGVFFAALALAVIPPLITGQALGLWLHRGLTFLVVSCPCALVISVPLSFFGGIGGASRAGVLVKGSNYLELLADTGTVVFDKTGTLTKGNFKVTEIHPVSGHTEKGKESPEKEAGQKEGPKEAPKKEVHQKEAQKKEVHQREAPKKEVHQKEAPKKEVHPKEAPKKEIRQKEVIEKEVLKKEAGPTEGAKASAADGADLLELAAYGENFSGHPIAQSIKKAYGKPIDGGRISGLEELPGYGIRVSIDGKRVLIGNGKLMTEEGIFEGPSGPEPTGTVVYLAVEGQYAGYILIEDELKADAAEAIRGLKSAGVKETVMLTGDADAVGRKTAKALGLDRVYTQLLPGDKVEKLEGLMTGKSGNLAFVGDGINDAPVLARADIGIAMGGLGSDAAVEAADVVIMTDEPSKIVTAMGIARKTLRIARQNILFALGVKGAVLILTIFGLASMQGAVFADVGVSVLAILNAMRAYGVKGQK